MASILLVVGGPLMVAGHLPAATVNYQNLMVGPNGALIGNLGDIFNIRGNFINNSTQSSVWDTHLSQVGFNASGAHQLAWTGTEQGRGNAGFVNNFAVGIFVLPSGASLTTSGGGALYTRVLVLRDGLSQLNSITGSPLNIHYNPGSPQNAYLNFQTYTLPNGSMLSPAAAPADFNAVWDGTTGNWSDATKWSGHVSPLNPSNSVTLYDASINGGTVTLDQTIGYIQKLNLGSGGTLTGPNSLTPWDTFTWGTAGNNNPSTISGGAIVNANGDITIVGDSARNLDNSTINNHAGYVATWAAGNSDLNFSNNAIFNNYGAFIVQNNRGLGHNGGTGTFNNYGTFIKNTGTGTTQVGSANFVFNNPGSISVQMGTLEFDGPLQGNGSISVASGTIGGNGAQLIFNSGTTAGGATITNQGATLRGALSGGQTLFNGGSTAGNATITANGGNDGQSGGPAPGGLTLFSGDANAGNSTLISTGGTFGGVSGSTRFKDTARAGTATITINNGVANDSGTFNDFFDHSTADSAHITANSGTTLGFHDSASGGNATLLTTGGPSFAPAGSEIDFYNTSTVGNANVTAASNTGIGGTLKFHDTSDAGHGVITTGTVGNAVGTTQFFDSSSAANGVFTTNGGTAGQSAPGAFIQFHNNSTAGSGAFTNNGTASFQANGAEMDLFDTSTAGNAMVTDVGAPNNGNGGITVFSNSSRAGTATFTNTGATAATNGNNGGGYTVFNAGTTADHATFINNGSSFNNATRTSGHTIFNAGSTADHGTFIANGSPTSTGVAGEVDLVNGATAGNGMFTTNPGMINGASGGLVDFSLGGSSGANGTFTNNGGAVSGASGGVTIFAANTTAGSALVTANGATSAGAGGATIGFFGNPDPANSTLVANGGSNGGAGGLILFIASPQSGQFFPASLVRIVANAGGTFDSSGAGQSLTVGSIEGAGQFLLGGGTLITGTLNTDTTVSGIIANGGSQGGSSGKLTKAGTGKLSLTGANTYTGLTTISGGTLQSANNGALVTTPSIAVNNAGSMLAVNYGGASDYNQTQIATLLSKTTFALPSTAFGFDTTDASGPVTYGNALSMPAGITMLGAGTLILTGANTYSGGTTVLGGTLKFNIISGAPTIAAGVTATVASGATLELAGSVSALGTATGNREHIVNNSLGAAGAPAGLVVSGQHQVVGGVDGLGSTQVDVGSDLKADHIIQNALVIGGTAGSPGLVTIDASIANGGPLGQPSGFAVADSLSPSEPFGAPDVISASVSSATIASPGLTVLALGKPVGGGNPAPVPEPSTLVLLLLAVLGALSTHFARNHFRCQSV